MNPIISIKNLHVHFKSKNVVWHVVRGIHFSLKPGEIIGIIGESGCGKSATLKTLVQLLPENTKVEGVIEYADRNLLNCSESEWQNIRKKEIAIILQDPMTALNPTQHLGKQLIEAYQQAFAASSYQEAYQAALKILDEVQLPASHDFMRAYAHALSGGMKQRLLIALALIRKPKVLIADEPTTALDAVTRSHILKLFKQYQQTLNMSIILVSHNLRGITKFCDTILVMYAGKIVEISPAEELFEKANHPYTRQLIQSFLSLNQSKTQLLHTIEGHPPSLNLPLEHCGFCQRCPLAMNICANTIPDLYQVDKSHWSACFQTHPGCR